MELLPGGITLDIPKGAFPLSTDSMALAHFAAVRKHASVLDLCSGCGTLGLLLCSKEPSCTVCGVEVDPFSHNAALENIRRNGLSARMESICAPVQSVSERFSPGSFTCCVANPPYFSGGPSSLSAPQARKEESCSMEELLHAAGWAVKFGGDVFLVHRPESLARLIVCGSAENLEAKELVLLRHQEDGPIGLILLRFRKGGKPGLKLSEWALYTRDGAETPLYRKIYHKE